jgi:hypothetical protein
MTKKVIEKNTEFKLPDDIVTATGTDPRDLVLIGIPKIGKGTILGGLTEKRNAIVLDLEKGGYEYIDARKVSTYDNNETTEWESFKNYIKFRNLLLENKGKYDYLIIDGLSDLDSLSVIGGTLAYMDTTIGKNFNRDRAGHKYAIGDAEWKEVTSLPEGAGYQHTRKWFMAQIEMFTQISPYRVYAAHIVDKYIKDNGKEEVIGGEIALTGQLKRIFASKVTALCKIVADGKERWLNFDVQNDSIVAGSRSSALKGRILISRMNDKDKIETFWENIYKENNN